MNRLWVEIVGTRGSTPRDAGTAMEVTVETTRGTIGGGALEHRAIALARDILAREGPEVTRTFPLGPDLGQCCGGAVTLRFTREPRRTDADDLHVMRDYMCQTARLHPRHLWLWGAGHVGRAVVRELPPQAFKVTWVDSAPDRFPDRVPRGVKAVPAADMPVLARRSEVHADHLIFTYSHDIDLALCSALLERKVESIGLIGSATKWARFQSRLRQLGHSDAAISRICCPIGRPELGKHPRAIAVGVIAALLRQRQGENAARDSA
ncbi:xanthine dehydrogenase accessory protein XdhC [Oceaniglobus roseus]|uniref:xanthine dehydrogenase accessory protein XdhC n=1 Tax=Oceaniglobus roseus TaxID=1737570 RepID=UPI000C7E88E1|nr:xanthine dehydrogenase accessory protein XdhC [Kandeliimicrobium roseum]